MEAKCSTNKKPQINFSLKRQASNIQSLLMYNKKLKEPKLSNSWSTYHKSISSIRPKETIHTHNIKQRLTWQNWQREKDELRLRELTNATRVKQHRKGITNHWQGPWKIFLFFKHKSFVIASQSRLKQSKMRYNREGVNQFGCLENERKIFYRRE